MPQISTSISSIKGTLITPVAVTTGETYTYRNSPSTVLVIEHYDASVPEGNACVSFVTPAKASQVLAIEDPEYILKPGQAMVFGAFPSSTFSSIIEFSFTGSDVNAGMIKIYVMEARTL